MIGSWSAVSAQRPSHALFGTLDLQRDGLKDVAQAVSDGDLADAERLLLEYYQRRTAPDFTPLPVRLDVARAEQNVRNVFTLRNATRDFGDNVDWHWEQDDKEWQYALNRMDWLSNFAGVYLETGDERFVQAWMEHVDGWIEAADDPVFPRTIDSGRRLRNMAVSYLAIVQHANSPTVTPEFNARILASMAEQAEHLAMAQNWRRYSNWGTVETSGLATFALLFPEFNDYDAWLHEIWFRMRVQLSEMYHDDGMHIEVSPLYHNHELKGWWEFIDLARANGASSPLRAQIPMRPDIDFMRRPAYALKHLYKPNGILPQVGDTDDITDLDFLWNLGALLDESSYQYVARAGREGSPPEDRSTAFHDSGYYVLRSGWGEAEPFEHERYLLFTSLSNHPWHAHYDILSIIADAYGYELLKDPGRFTYNDEPDRDHIKSSAAHNTVVIDGQDQPRQYTPPPADWVSMAGFDFVSGRYDGHEEVVHDRSIFFPEGEYWVVIDRLSGATTNRHYDLYWHLAERALGHVEVDERARVIASPNLLIASPGVESEIHLEENWISRYYRQRETSPSIRLSMESSADVVWPTVLYPYPDGDPADLDVERIETSDDHVVALQISVGGVSDYVVERAEGGVAFDAGPIRTDARLAFVRMDAQGGISAVHMIGGSFLDVNGTRMLDAVGEDVAVSASNGRVEVEAGLLLRFATTLPADAGFTVSGAAVDLDADVKPVRYVHPLITELSSN